MFLLNFVVFIFGLLIGSFLNVVIFRLETEETIINDRSKCQHCKHILSWKDLFPVLSFFLLQGKCRYCQKKISIQYPIVELITAIGFVIVFNYFFITEEELSFFQVAFYSYTVASFVVISIYDLRHYIIPDKVIYPTIAIALLFNFIFYNFLFLNSLLAAVLAFGFFFAIILITKGKGMGGGDAKLGFLMGLILGFPLVFLAIILASILGSVVGIALIVAKKKKAKSMIPFGPFLVAGTLISIFYGEEIVRWYFGFLV